MDTINFHPIGYIHSPFDKLDGMPIQPSGAKDALGYIELSEDLQEGLKDLEGFSHIILLYHFHKNEGYKLSVKPFMDTVERGLFSTRAPRRPNMIGMSTVELREIKGNIIKIKGVDVLNGTPLIDIKPYVAKFDAVPADRFGWLEKNAKKSETLKSDTRFVGDSD
ncbi:tRNA-Thr(GGU) m(6)t(6)A37 methyltransferase TsaA [Maridesulfovibrio ferrireducens]|uniref:tRNA-Thr(GGU) m(6)t(6)A37 methyltransferase TsaA n=1 Tax=Maridesulfovibrio ferrireducens TaxID=246191 RepID=A0A1G9CAB1_9BACT|nr:tRNA (N6-threonylcarbamoyladenosine(37)-N6)-methyltransferase TrmO [Maridesulfovibrio ferrireducens]SDK48590.1 tRNA-Thr(GGU) m(6)t(6)A37 methyltransferase TsaA [Maridesulfovibrio ferrireducens]